MGISTHVKGFISQEDSEYIKHSKVLKACIEAKVSNLPKETAEYFGGDYPEEYLLEEKLEVNIPKYHWTDGFYSSGYEIIVSEIPKGVHKIRFTNSW